MFRRKRSETILRRLPIKLPFWAAFFVLAGCGLGEPPSARFVKQIEWMEQGTWVKADTHVHTRFSDGAHSVSEVVQQAVANGCDVIAITDHGDRNRRAATPEYFEEIRAARRIFPGTIIFAGLEWNIPPWGGDEHATVLVPPAVEDRLREFQQRFDDHGRERHEQELADQALRWLAENGTADGILPVVIYNHPSRKDDNSTENIADLQRWRGINNLVIGFSGAPGHQGNRVLGSYASGERLIDRWDPAAARVGDAWDTLLQQGMDVWAARAPSDFHNSSPNGLNDFPPGKFSETWLYVPQRSADGVLQALHAGSFFAAHGHIVRDVRLTVDAPGLERPAYPGETIEMPAGTQLAVTAELDVPFLDWSGTPNRIDSLELIAVTEEGASIILEQAPRSTGPSLLEPLDVPPGGMVLRLRGRRIIADGPDLMFYTNPIRIVERPGFDWTRLTGLFPSQWSLRQWAGLVLVGLAAYSLLTMLLKRRKTQPVRPVYQVEYIGRKGLGPATPPRRGHYALFAVLFALFIAYGSTVPLQFDSTEFDDAVRQFQQRLVQQGGRPGRVDFSTNVLLTIPLSFAALGSLLVDRSGLRRKLTSIPLVALLCLAVTLLIEFAQIWLPGRVSSKFDVLAQLIGTAIGILLWLFTGQRITSWLRSYAVATRPAQQIDWILKTYLVGLVIYNLIPFDLTMHPADLYQKLRDEKIIPIPFSGRTFDGNLGWELLFDVLTFIPVGVLTCRWFTSAHRPVRSVLEGTIFGMFIVGCVELSQLFVMSRFTETTDLLTGTFGIWIGAMLMNRWSATGATVHRTGQSELFVRAGKWLGLAVVYAVFLCAFYWRPFELLEDSSLIQARWEGFWHLPFSRMQRSSNMRSHADLVTKILIFAPLGAMLAQTVYSVVRAPRAWLLAAAWALAFGLGLLIEFVQSVVAVHIPDVTDVMLYSLGALVGLFAVTRIHRSSRDTRNK